MKLGFSTLKQGRLGLHIVPIIVWLAALAGVVSLLQERSRHFAILGIAQGQSRMVQATVTGRLVELRVELFHEVKEGDILAVLDTITETEYLEPEIKAERAVHEAEIERLRAELNATHEKFALEVAQRQTDAAETYRQLSSDVQKAHHSVLELKTTLEPDRIRLTELDVKVRSFLSQSTVVQNPTGVYDYKMLQLQYEALRKTIEENEKLLAKSEEDLVAAQESREKFSQTQPPDMSLDSALEPIRRAIAVEEKRIEYLLVKREPLILRAPFSGLVSEISHRTGEVIMPGDPVLTISENKPREIAAWVSEGQANLIEKDMRVRLVKDSEPAQIADSQVIFLGPNVELVPQRLWDNPDTPKWGRRMLIAVHPDLRLLPGEVVGIREM
jgi:multidrug resistance efflux pump